MTNKKKLVYHILFFTALLSLTFYMLLKDMDIKTLRNIIHTIRPHFFILGLMIAIVYVLCESVAFKIIFKTLNLKTKFIHLIRYSFIGFYFSAITPSATGGQPMQMYYMNKKGIPFSKSSLTILICVLCYQTSLIGLFIASFIFQYPVLQGNISKIRWLLIITGAVNVIIWLFFVGMLFSKRLLPALITSLFKFLSKIKIVKNINEKIIKINNTMEEYRRCAVIVKENKTLMLKILLIYIFQLTLRFSISYLAARALNIQTGTLIDFITVQSIILFCVASFPLPGGVGISETLYITLFTVLVPFEKINVAALVTQVMNYYFIVFIATGFVIYSYIRYHRKN